MLMLLSPAKTLDYETPAHVATFSQPGWLDQSQLLIDRLRLLSPVEVSKLMDISDALAVLNVTRYADWAPPFTPTNAKQAVLAFAGDVYEGLDAAHLSVEDLEYAQGCLRMLSGLYGLLKPLDLIQPYRLEMGTKLDNLRGKDLYAFWGTQLAEALNAQLAGEDDPVVVNLASEEYFKAIKPKLLKARVMQPVFEDWKGGKFKIISFYAKRARGLMARYAITQRAKTPENLKSFDLEGYRFVSDVSDDKTLVFRRQLEA